nr:urease accessory protein UreE [uncultured Gellertiella sp.]
MPQKAITYLRAANVTGTPQFKLTLDAQDRHIRRKRMTLNDGTAVLVDLEKAVQLADGDCLVLEDGALVEILAAHESLLQITAASPRALMALAWHIGNRHLDAQIEENRILIRPDHVIAHMLEHQGAVVAEIRESFTPEPGAYHQEIGFEHDYSLTESHGHRHEPGHRHAPDRPHLHNNDADDGGGNDD